VDAPRQTVALEAALEAKNSARIAKTARDIKGAAAMAAAAPVLEAAQHLEQLGRAGDLTEVHDAVTVLRQTMDALLAEIARASR
jgi:HPt (histidine-containing phosphotransfer) domain-containing protein